MLQTTTNQFNRSTNESLETVNRNINQFLENVSWRVEALQQQCDQSREEISKLRKENVRLAARIKNHNHYAVDQDKSKISMSLAVIIIAVILSFLLFNMGDFSLDQTTLVSLDQKAPTSMDQNSTIDTNKHQSKPLVNKLRDSNSLPHVAVLPAPVTFIMTDYSKHKENNDSWHSPPFYTMQCWRIMRLRVDANGNGPDKGTQVSVFAQLLPGENDDQLKWPLQGEITIQLIRQNRWTGSNDWERKILFLETTPIAR